jgi:FHS family L-fucose permease-like MFS transporter
MTKASQAIYAIILTTSLFFFWGFIHNLDPILIPHLRNAFSLNTFQASLVDASVFLAYFFFAIPAGMLMKRYGYKWGMIVGLILFGLGCFLLVLAASTIEYYYFLLALFVVATGLTVLETVANPYITLLGDPSKSTQRLNLAQSFNGLAAFIAPIIGGRYILSEEPLPAEAIAALSAADRIAYIQSETESVKMPYFILGIVIFVVAILIYFTRMPEPESKNKKENLQLLKALGLYRVRWAVVAQFFYVGAQVCVLSFLVLYATDMAALPPQEAKYYGAIAGLAFMLGRFFGTSLMKWFCPLNLVFVFSLVCIALILTVVFAGGYVGLVALIIVSFFMSIMFPTIFAEGIKGAGEGTYSASSLIIMSIVGGALLPLLFGLLSDTTGLLLNGYWVVVVCFFVTALFAVRIKKMKQS